MTKKEFAVIADAIKSAYPTKPIMATKPAFNLWYQMLKDLDYETAYTAVINHIASKIFEPTIAEIREACLKVTEGEEILWDEAWDEVCTAIRRYGYMRKEEALESMSPMTAEVVRNLGWMTLCQSETPSVDRANFRDIYIRRSERQREKAKLTPRGRAMIEENTCKRLPK